MPTRIDYAANIARSGLSIYDPVRVGDPNLWIPSTDLERILTAALNGVSLHGLPLRTRSKVVKSLICKALGYQVPASFVKTNPRFPGQNFDTYIQKSNNLQVWNEELDPSRRYVIIRVGGDDKILNVRVVLGDRLADLDTTGTLTQKYQARLVPGAAITELVNRLDTDALRPFLATGPVALTSSSPVDSPSPASLLPIASVFDQLSALVGERFPDVGYDQERNRGAALHRIVCKALGYKNYADDGQFPDIRHQLIEVKLQTSPTIDLGLVTPDSQSPLDVPQLGNYQVRHCDVRYAIFYAEIASKTVVIRNVYLTSGASFFERFPRFGGKVLNKKLQIPLPADFFD